MFTATKLNKLTVLMSMVCLWSLTGFSQKTQPVDSSRALALSIAKDTLPKAIIDKQDTLIAFSIPQSKELLKEVHAAKHHRELNQLNEQIIDSLQLQIIGYLSVIDIRNEKLASSKKINEIQHVQLEQKAAENASLQKTIKKERFLKTVAIITGTAGTIVFGVLYLTK